MWTVKEIPKYAQGYNTRNGLLPRLRVNGLDYWGDGLSWNKAIELFKAAIPNMR